MTRVTFDARFVNEIMEKAQQMSADECEWCSTVGADQTLRGKFDRDTIRMVENIYWTVAQAKRATA